MEAPFTIGQRVHPDQLQTWEYLGLSGKPGRDRHSIRRFRKGDWVLELRALQNRHAATRVVSIRTVAEDQQHWTELRMQLKLHEHKHV